MIRPKENYGDRVLFIFFDVFLCFFVLTSGKTCDTFCCVAVFCLAWYNKENINKNELLPDPPPGRLPTEQREWVQARCPGKPRLGQAGRPEAGTSAQHWKINKKIHAQASLVLKEPWKKRIIEGVTTFIIGVNFEKSAHHSVWRSEHQWKCNNGTNVTTFLSIINGHVNKIHKVLVLISWRWKWNKIKHGAKLQPYVWKSNFLKFTNQIWQTFFFKWCRIRTAEEIHCLLWYYVLIFSQCTVLHFIELHWDSVLIKC